MQQSPIKILLIEHDAGFAGVMGEMLSKAGDLGAEMRSVSDLTSGMSSLSRDNFDLVLLDVSIPDGAGLASVSIIKSEAPQLPVIVAGDSDDERVALEAVQAGAQDYLVKAQLSPSWLERSIRYAIERHRMDMALLAAEEKYHSIFDHLVEGIFQTTPDGHYLLANSALSRIYGYASPEDLMQSVTDIGRRLYVQEGRRDEFVRIMQERDTITGFESQIYRKDQSIIWISENCRAIRDSKNRLLYYEGTVEDITQRKLAEERLRDSEELYQSLVETLPQNIFRKDLQDRFTFANQVFCKTLGKSLDEIIGKTDFDFYEKDLAAKYQADDHKVRETGVPYDTVEENQSRGHSKMYVQVVKTPLRGANGQVIGLQGIFWDITEQRLNEEKVRRVNSLLAQNRKELRAKNMQMQDDLKMAREIQLAMLPQQNTSITPDPTDALAAYSLTHRYLPTGTVGGDFFSLAAISETEAGVFICDVAGHGVRSALVTAMIRALVEELKPLAREPGAFLSKLNRELYAILKHTGTPMLTTAFYLVADWKANQMHYSNAGHPKPLHLRRSNGTVQPLVNASGKAQPALGLFEDAAYQTTSAPLSRGDLVMLYTDGLVEVQNTKGEIYSQDLLIQCVQPRMKLPAAQLFDETLAEVRKFSDNGSFSDDVCIVGMEVNSIS